ncbi:MAG: L-lactate permease [Candidatus Omnitrophota bacterium]
MTAFFCWSPVLFMALLAIVFKRPALDLAVICLLFTFGLAVFYFQTPAGAAALAGADGVLTTLPLLLVVFAGIFLCNLLMETGSLKRIVEWFSGGVRNAHHREWLIALGVANFMEGAGVIAEPVVAPMLRAAGTPPMGAAALSIIGYSGLMTLELAGIIITVLSLATGLPIGELGIASAWLSIPATICMAACVPLFSGLSGEKWRRFLPPMACGLLVGSASLASAYLLGAAISGMAGGLALIIALILAGSRRLPIHKDIVRDLAPFAFLLIVLPMVNAVPTLNQLTYQKLIFTLQIIPAHKIVFRPFYSSYLYLFAACLLTVWLFHWPQDRLFPVLKKSLRIGLRVSLTMGLFGAMGQMIAYTGYSDGFAEFHPQQNIPWLIAHGLVENTGKYYPIFAPLLGWVGTFLTGYGVASFMLFGLLQVETARLLGVSPVWLAAGLAVGASLGSISSPFKIALAAPMCEAVGLEGLILRKTIPLGLAAALVIGLILWLLV